MLKEIFLKNKKAESCAKKQGVYIAEIGLNHNGDFLLAKEMTEAASMAGADGVKFQTIKPELLNSVYTRSLMESGRCDYADTSVLDFFKRFSFSEDEYAEIKFFAEGLGLVFFSSPFDAESLALLEALETPVYKIASSEVTNLQLIERIGATGKPALMSTGISQGEEIGAAIDAFRNAGGGELGLLHCVSAYPTEPADANLMRIVRLREEFKTETGFSDHSRDGRALPLAGAVGARIFERHFTVDRNLDCPDKDVSSDPEQFRKIIEETEQAILMAGDGSIGFGKAEESAAKNARRSLFAAVNISAGAVVKETDIIALRPGAGISAAKYKEICGLRAKANIPAGSLLAYDMFESR